MRIHRLLTWLAAASALALGSAAGATTLVQMDLAQLTSRAGTIFRGTIVDVEQGTVNVGGGSLPAVTYTLAVHELLKGEATLVKDDRAVMELRFVGSIKAAVPQGEYQHFSAFRHVPRLQMGSDYLLFTTATSAAGLSVPVGLGQGAFRIFLWNRQDHAVNEFDNLGLGLDGDGPVPYSDLTAKIRALLGQ